MAKPQNQKHGNNQREGTKPTIFEVISKHREYTSRLEMGYVLIQNLPRDVRKDFLAACEGIG